MIFDLDGTLVDSEPVANRALLDLLPDLGKDVDELVVRYRGQSFPVVLADIERRLKRSLPADFERHYRAHADALFETELKPMSNAADMLAALPLPRGLASSGPMAKIRRSLALTDLDPFFGDRVYSSYDIGSWKPEPDLFLYAARKMGFAPAACVVVEDSIAGITAALAAGMSVIRYDPIARGKISDDVPLSPIYTTLFRCCLQSPSFNRLENPALHR